MPLFTVIGYYQSDGAVYADTVRATNARHAMRISATLPRSYSAADDLYILGALPGDYSSDFVCACEDSGKEACATDLLEDES